MGFSLSEIGVGLAGFGIAFLFMGMLMFFDKGLLAIGNVSVNDIFSISVHNISIDSFVTVV